MKDVYFIMGPLHYWVIALNSTGCHFSNVDRGTAVNIDNVIRLDRTCKVAHFDTAIGQNALHCKIACERYALVEQEMIRNNPNIIVC